MALYTIEGAQNFRATADDPETAVGLAAPAVKKFSPLKIMGPNGPMTSSELKRDADAAKLRRAANKP